MTMETDLHTLLLTECTRVFPDVAPNGTAHPFVTWQGLGGEAVSYVDSTAPDKRFTLMQITVWSTTRLDALELVRSIEAALRAASAFVCTPQGEAISTTDPATKSYGCIQRFEIVAAR